MTVLCAIVRTAVVSVFIFAHKVCNCLRFDKFLHSQVIENKKISFGL
jgi:hypothetical protein